MKQISEHIFNACIKAIKSIDDKTLEDIYGFSFYVYDENDDPRYPTLTIGFNTNTNFKNEIDAAWDESEAKWNYAFWLQNEITVLGNEEDKEGRKIIEDWISSIGLNYTDQDEEKDFDACMEKGGEITENFVSILVETVREIHKAQITTKPILIHELEYYDQIRDQNIEANGKERVIEFTNWINEMYN
ncbi:hypothetical protein [Flavivirga algicola]|uniref:DUF4303 domain-containing protein n=1 Tax=Flavivirga algicola TaxID=2729136 RepID=A0ABX1RUB2_9FLAO|nr:hypothetical protein [Flavivirga algicola]NMH86766.1 hypothetical protein [Flavivirga algicola]